MALWGALKLVALMWNYPLIFCLFLLLFTPALFPIVLYFSPLFISTGLCAIALVSINMADTSPGSESEDDPYLRRWQAEQSSKPPNQQQQQKRSWSQWLTQAEEKTRVWIDSRLTPQQRKQVSSDDNNDHFRWKVIHDNDDENELRDDDHILPPPSKPTKIKYGTRTVDEDGDHQEEAKVEVERTSIPVTGVNEDVRNGNSEEIREALELNDESVVTQSRSISEEKRDSLPPVHVVAAVVAERMMHHASSNQELDRNFVDKSKPPSRPPPPFPVTTTRRYYNEQQPEGRRDVTTNDNNSSNKEVTPTVGLQGAVGEGVAPTVVEEIVVQDIASHAMPLSSSSTLQDAATAQQELAGGTSAAISSHTSSPDEAPTVNSARLIGALDVNFLHRNQVQPDLVVESSTQSERRELEVPGVFHASPAAPSTPPTQSMNEDVAEARMRKPEPVSTTTITYDAVKSRDMGGLVRDEQFVSSQEVTAEGEIGGKKDIDQPELHESELGVPRSDGEVHENGVRWSTHPNIINSESTTFPSDASPPPDADFLDESEIPDRSEKVIFVDESSKVGSNYAMSKDQDKITAGGVWCPSDTIQKRGLDEEVDVDRLLVPAVKEYMPQGQSGIEGDVAAVIFSATISTSILPKEGGEGRPGSSSVVDNGIHVHTSRNEEMQQNENRSDEDKKGLPSNSSFGSSESAEAVSSIHIVADEAEILYSVETSERGNSVAEGLSNEKLEKRSGTDHAQNVEIEAVLSEETEDVISSKEDIFPVNSVQKGDRDGERETSASGLIEDADVQDLTASDKVDGKRSSPSLKMSSSMPVSSRQVRKRSTLAKAISFAEEFHQDNSDSDSEGDEAVRGKSRTTKNVSLDSVEEVTARLSKKYNPTWTKVRQMKESAEQSRSSLALMAIVAPTDEPVDTTEIRPVDSPKESPSLPERKGSDETTDSYMVSMKKVLSAVKSGRNRDKDGAGKGQPQISEKKGLSSVLRINRERFTSPLRRQRSTVKEKEKAGGTTGLTDLAEEEGKPSADKFKDLLMVPLVKAFSSEARVGSGSSNSGRKPDTARELNPQGSSSPALSISSSGHKGRTTETEAVADGKVRGRFILPLKKRFSSDSREERRKKDSTGSASQTPDRSGPLILEVEDKKFKSPDKRFSLSWNKKRHKDDNHSAATSQREEVSPGSIFEKPRSPGISAETTARLISQGNSNSCTSSPIVDEDEAAAYLKGELCSQERSLFWPLSKQREKERESSSLTSELTKEKERGVKSSSSSWWTRKRDKVVVEEATIVVPEDDQATREYVRLFPQKLTARRGHDFKSSPEETTITRSRSSHNYGVENLDSADRNSTPQTPSSSKNSEKSEPQYPLSVRSRVNEGKASPAPTHRREHSDNIQIKFRGHERRMSLPEFDTTEGDQDLTSGEYISPFNQNSSQSVGRTSSASKPQHLRHRSSDVIGMYSRRSEGQELSPFDGARSNMKVKELYRNLDFKSPSSNVEIRITDKLKVPLEEVLSLLAVGDSSSAQNSTVAAVESSSSSGEETSSSEEEWSSSDDEHVEENSAAASGEHLIAPLDRAKESWAFYERNRQLPFVDD
ncbi:hypothetical protein R1flu_016335 [Riccia fluitans]|uniref:Uncharacterized protein n=1 Tax=Riccia fluitans TaxID=41844 RepID=A0ABD1YMK8_9MARC